MSGHNKIKLSFSVLCELLKPKLAFVDNAMQYVEVGEYALALEFISDWCVDEVPEVELSANDFFKIKEIGDLIKKEGPWIELFPLLADSEIDSIPIVWANQAQRYIREELVNHPLRKKWLSKIKTVIDKISSS